MAVLENTKEFLTATDCEPMLNQLLEGIDNITRTWNTIEDIQNTVSSFIHESCREFLDNQPNFLQQHTNFKKSLFSSLENVVMTALHEKIFNVIMKNNKLDDELIYSKCCNLSALKITPDQLGALEDYCIPLPAAIVELASLDMHESPADKLQCLSTAFDLALAELKGAIVDVISLSCDNTIPTLNVSDITPILAAVVIHAKPMHIISNMFYIENFYWSELTNTESECLLAFKTAIDKIKVVTTDVLLPRSTRIYCDIGLEDVFKLASDVDDKFNRTGHRICTPNNPLERHIEQFTNMITASTFKDVKM